MGAIWTSASIRVKTFKKEEKVAIEPGQNSALEDQIDGLKMCN